MRSRGALRQAPPPSARLLPSGAGLFPEAAEIRHNSGTFLAYPKGWQKVNDKMIRAIRSFLTDEAGVVSVDWTMLSAAAVSLALATAGALSGAFQTMISRVDAELRTQQLSDDFVQFTSAHFEPLYELGLLDPESAGTMFDTANDMMNADIISALQEGITALEDGLLNSDEIAALIAIASVAWQRNIVPDTVLDYYFGFGGNQSPRVSGAL